MRKRIAILIAITVGAWCAVAAANSMDVTLSEAGGLEEALGENVLDIDSLLLRGQVGQQDFKTMAKACYNGRLTYIDMSESEVENRAIPDSAFYIADSGCRSQLRKIILPENIKEFGTRAFCSLGELLSINMPKALETLGTGCFEYSGKIYTGVPVTLPEGIREISDFCFRGCKLFEEITLPQSLEKIGFMAFNLCWVSRIELPSDLKLICGFAFEESEVKELDIPDGCGFEGICHFQGTYSLRRLRLPADLKEIPESFAFRGYALEEVIMPEALEKINELAFGSCGKLTSVSLPESTAYIGSSAFSECISMKELNLPPMLDFLGIYAINCPNMERLYCRAIVPPECADGKIVLNVAADLPVYVPVGTADIYRNAPGWNYFTNFIETSDFPQSSVAEVEEPCSGNPVSYDLQGRRLTSEPARGTVYIKDGRKNIRR